jgi:hypothetical protein
MANNSGFKLTCFRIDRLSLSAILRHNLLAIQMNDMVMFLLT